MYPTLTNQIKNLSLNSLQMLQNTVKSNLSTEPSNFTLLNFKILYFIPEYQLQSEVVNTSNVAGRKGKISRTQFSIYQKVALENSFLSSLYLTGEERDALAFKLGLSPAIVQVSAESVNEHLSNLSYLSVSTFKGLISTSFHSYHYTFLGNCTPTPPLSQH